MRMMVRSAACLTVAGWLAVLAHAGVVVQQEGGKIGDSKKQQTTLYLDSGKIRMEAVGPDGKKNVTIFDQAKQVLWHSNTAESSYIEMTQAQVEAMANQMGDMMKQMEAQLAQVPPAQREMMEKMMKGRMGGMGSAAPTITVQEKGSGEKVGPYTTTRYEILTNGQRTSEVWAAPRDIIHLQESDFQAFQALAKFFAPLARMAPKGSWSAPAMESIQGFPVRTVSYEGEKPAYEWTVVSADQRSVEASLFTLPAGLKKTDMMGAGGMGRPGR